LAQAILVPVVGGTSGLTDSVTEGCIQVFIQPSLCIMMTEVVAQADASEMLESQHTAAEQAVSAGGAEDTNTGILNKCPTKSTSVSAEDPAFPSRDESASTGSNPNTVVLDTAAVVADLEAGAAEPAKACADEPAKRRPVWQRKRFLCLGALGIFLAGLSVFLCFVLPLKDPEWHLTALDIDVGRFTQVMMGGGNLSEPMFFTADVEFSNKNIIGTTTEPGTFEVLCADNQVFATGTTDSVTVGGKSSATMSVAVTAKFTQSLVDDIVAEVMANNMEFKVHANVLVIAKVGLLRVKVHVRCDVTAATTRLFSDPATVVKDKSCSYSYTL